MKENKAKFSNKKKWSEPKATIMKLSETSKHEVNTELDHDRRSS